MERGRGCLLGKQAVAAEHLFQDGNGNLIFGEHILAAICAHIPTM